MRRTLCPSLALAALAACSDGATAPGTGIVSVATDRAVYALRDTVHATLANTGASRVGYDPCEVAIERRDASGRWTSMGPVGMTCLASLLSLAPGESMRLAIPLPVSFTSGQYRARLDRVDDARGRTLPAASRTSTVSFNARWAEACARTVASMTSTHGSRKGGLGAPKREITRLRRP